MINDLTGQTFGYWTVIKFAGHDIHNNAQFLCRCRCGTEKVVIGSNLRSAHSKSCGCRKRDIRARNNNLTGQVFGNLTVIKPAGVYRHKYSLSLCRCKCGRELVVRNASLKSGLTKSCGYRSCSTQLKKTRVLQVEMT